MGIRFRSTHVFTFLWKKIYGDYRKLKKLFIHLLFSKTTQLLLNKRQQKFRIPQKKGLVREMRDR